jgi:hypothetical protein
MILFKWRLAMSVWESMELPKDAFSALRTTPEGFVKEMRLAAAAKMASAPFFRRT